MNQMRVQHSIEYSDHILNVSYVISRMQQAIEFNYHYDIANLEDLRRSISKYKENMVQSEKLAEKLISARSP
jgi:hypothetical protein